MLDRETEVVFAASAKQIERLPDVLRGIAASVRARPVHVVEDRYLDTATRLLMKAGVACRLRNAGKRTTLALKSLTPFRKGLADRVELQEDLPHEEAVLPGPVPGSALRARLLPLARCIKVQCLFTLEQERRVYDVRTQDDARIEISGDYTRLIGVGADNGIRRIEVELQEGKVASLVRVAAELRRALKLKPAKGSKFKYGLRQAGLSMPRPAEGASLRIRPQDSVRKAAARALTLHLRRMAWHAPGTRLGIDPECLHQTRVNVRRLRAILRLFRDFLPPATTAELAAELRWLGQSLGTVRDLDVHIEGCVSMHGGPAGSARPAAEECRRKMCQRRDRAYEALRRDLGSPRFRSLNRACRDLIRMLHRPVASNGRGVAEEGATLMASDFRKLLKSGRAIGPNSPDEALHSLRVRCKRLRYACETLRDVYGKPVAKMARRLAALQDVLGAHQDTVAAQALIERTIGEAVEGAPCSLGVAYALGECAAGWREQQLVRRASFEPAWRAFDRKKARQGFLKALQRH